MTTRLKMFCDVLIFPQNDIFVDFGDQHDLSNTIYFRTCSGSALGGSSGGAKNDACFMCVFLRSETKKKYDFEKAEPFKVLLFTMFWQGVPFFIKSRFA